MEIVSVCYYSIRKDQRISAAYSNYLFSLFTITCASFCWPKQVVWPNPKSRGGKVVLPPVAGEELCSRPKPYIWHFRTDHGQSQGFVWSASWVEAVLPMLDLVPGTLQSLEVQLRTHTFPSVTSHALKDGLIPSPGASIKSSLLGTSAGALPRHILQVLFVGALAESFYSPLTQYFCTLSLSLLSFLPVPRSTM